MMYLCPNCEKSSEVQIMNTYPPRKLKCIRCGFQGIEHLFEIHRHEKKAEQENEFLPVSSLRSQFPKKFVSF